jgi:DNA-binding HxlR family transcriptional regulator
MARLLIHFVLHPGRTLGFRALERHTGLGHRSLVNELERLSTLGIVTREVPETGPGPLYREPLGAHALRTERLLSALSPTR